MAMDPRERERTIDQSMNQGINMKMFFFGLLFLTIMSSSCHATELDNQAKQDVVLSNYELTAINTSFVSFRKMRFHWLSYNITLHETSDTFEVSFSNPDFDRNIDYVGTATAGAPPTLIARQETNLRTFVVVLGKQKLTVIKTYMCCR